ncbi:MAG: alanine racemase [Acidobacteriota bacterium]
MAQRHLHAFDDATRDDRVLAWIAERHADLPTPLYLYSAAALADSAAAYRSLFPPGARGFYSLKSNPQPGLLRRFAELGLGAEVVSPGEWQVARDAGVGDLLVGGVSRSGLFFSRVLRETVPTALVIDSRSEWRRLAAAASGDRPVPVLLRINPGLSFGGLNMAGGTQFGLSPGQAVELAAECAAHPGTRFLGLHVYFGSQRLKNEPVLKALDEIEKVIEGFPAATKPRVVDLGLGLGVPYLGRDPELDLDALGADLRAKWAAEPWSDLDIWFEAGRALVARSGYFVSRVTEKKTLHDKTFVFLDGGISVHNPGIGVGRFFRDNPRFCFLSRSREAAAEKIDIVGNLCTSADHLGSDVQAPPLEEGDLVVVPNSGAYCTTTGMWGFNSQGLFAEAILEEDGALSMLEAQYHQLAGRGAAEPRGALDP